MKTAQSDAAIPINAIMLSPSIMLEKSNKVILKIISANAKKTKM